MLPGILQCVLIRGFGIEHARPRTVPPRAGDPVAPAAGAILDDQDSAIGASNYVLLIVQFVGLMRGDRVNRSSSQQFAGLRFGAMMDHGRDHLPIRVKD